MLYIFSLLYIIVKGLLFVINHEILFHLTTNNLIFLFILILSIFCLKKVLAYKKIYPNITDHMMQYRFKSRREYYYLIAILLVVIVSYISTIIFLRVRAFNKPVDLTVLYTFINELCKKMSKGMLCYNLFILVLIIYLFLLIIKFLKKRLNIHVTKMHFYLISFEKYITIHSYFRDYISLNARIIWPLCACFSRMQDFVFCLYLFGYYKDDRYMFMTEEDIPILQRTKKYIWTTQEITLISDLDKNYGLSRVKLSTWLRYFLYNLHFIALILVISYDVLYNNYVLKHVAFILPFLFVYQIYILLCQFVQDKIAYDISLEINTLYYKNIELLGNKLVKINGEIYERPNYKQIIEDFLKYEDADFYYTRIKH